MLKPVILLAFANYEQNNLVHLRGLSTESQLIVNALKKAEDEGVCEVVRLLDADISRIVDVFARKTISVFHFAGHANDFELMVSEDQNMNGKAFAEFLGKQPSLQLVVLNACSTKGHVDEILNNGVPVVIATSRAIKDKYAVQFAKTFYTYIGLGKSIFFAFNQFEAQHKIAGTKAEEFYIDQQMRTIVWEGMQNKETTNSFPWFHVQKADVFLKWNLADASQNPLFGLPEVKHTITLPDNPYLQLQSYRREHAEIFYGRDYQIRELYDKISDPLCPQVLLVYGQSGVGKSSLVAAGLMPYVEIEQQALYIRRNAEQGLVFTLRDALQVVGTRITSKEAWLHYEERIGKPLILILDQVEEVFTRPVSIGYNEQWRLTGTEQFASNEKVALLKRIQITNDDVSDLLTHAERMNTPIAIVIREAEQAMRAWFNDFRASYEVVFLPKQRNELLTETFSRIYEQSDIDESKPLAVVLQESEEQIIMEQQELYRQQLMQQQKQKITVPYAPEYYEAKVNEQLAASIPQFTPSDELEALISELKEIFGDKENKPKGKILLCYHKAYHSEIDARIKKQAVSRTRTFIEPLDRESIIEVAEGLTKKSRTANQYKLTIEERLPTLIADDLIEVSESPISPYLQLTLHKLWEKAIAVNEYKPDFTQDDYLQIKRKGDILEMYVLEQLTFLAKQLPEAEEQGMLLELLHFFTPEKNENSHLQTPAEAQNYFLPEQKDTVSLSLRLLQPNILTETNPEDRQVLKLGFLHDMLVPIVKKIYAESDKPVQRAVRILQNKKSDWRQSKQSLILGNDMLLVEQTMPWMPQLDDLEKRIIKQSKKRQRKLERRKRWRQISLYFFIGLLSIMLGITYYFMENAKEKTKVAVSLNAVYKSQNLLEEYPTKSFQIARYSYKLNKNPQTYAALWHSYQQSKSYSEYTLPNSNTVINVATAIAQNSFYSIDKKGQILQWALGENSPKELPILNKDYKHLAVSPNGNVIAFATDTTLSLMNVNGQLLDSFSFEDRVAAIQFSKNQQQIMVAFDTGAVFWFNWIEKQEQKASIYKRAINGICSIDKNTTVYFVDNEVSVWQNQIDLIKRWKAHTEPIISYAANKNYIATAAVNDSLKLWDTQGNLVQQIPTLVQAVALLNKGLVVVNQQNELLLFSLKGNLISKERLPQQQLLKMEVWHDNNNYYPVLLLTFSDGRIRKWQVNKNRFVQASSQVQFDITDNYLLSANNKHEISLWSYGHVPPLEWTIPAHTNTINAIAFKPNGSQLASAASDSLLKLWSPFGKLAEQKNSSNAELSALASSKDGTYLLGATKNASAFVILPNGKTVALNGHTQAITHALFLPNNDMLTAANNELIVWDLQGKIVATINDADSTTAIAYHKEKNYILTANKNQQLVKRNIDFSEKEIILQYKAKITDIAISNNNENRLIALTTNSAKNNVNLLTDNFTHYLRFNASKNGVQQIGFSNNGQKIYTLSTEGIIEQWPLDAKEILKEADARVLPMLSIVDEQQYQITNNFDGLTDFTWLDLLLDNGNAALINQYINYFEEQAENCKEEGAKSARAYQRKANYLKRNQ